MIATANLLKFNHLSLAMAGKFNFDIDDYVGDRADKTKVGLGLTTWLVLSIEKSHYGWPKRQDVLYEVIRSSGLDRSRLDKTRVDRSWFNPLCKKINKEYGKLRGDAQDWRDTATERRDDLKKAKENMEHLRLKYNALVRYVK